jgi:uncharacterized membrane protein
MLGSFSKLAAIIGVLIIIGLAALGGGYALQKYVSRAWHDPTDRAGAPKP